MATTDALPILRVDDGEPFRAVVIVEDALLGRNYAGTIRLEEFERIEGCIRNGFMNLDFPPLAWVECRRGTAVPVRHGLLVSILVSRMRARASGSPEGL